MFLLVNLLFCVRIVSFIGVQSRNTCPTIYNCDTDYNPGDFQSLEQGYFEVDGQECPGCQICIHKGWFIFTKWQHLFGFVSVKVGSYVYQK